MVPVVKESYT